MSMEQESVQEVPNVPAESNGDVGEPKGSEISSGESVEKGAKGEPSGEGLFDGMTPEQLHKSYKSLQGEYTKAQTVAKKLEKYGGPDQLTQWADFLSADPDFAKWVQSKQNKNVLGTEEVDADQQRALDAVRKIAESIVDQRVKELHQNEVAPLSEAYKQQILQSHFGEMDKKYGADWNELRDEMSLISESLPASIQDNPSFDDIEDLYFKALRKTGKLETYAEKIYTKKLNDKKSKAMEKPNSIPQAGSKPASTIQEAYEMAKRAHNIS